MCLAAGDELCFQRGDNGGKVEEATCILNAKVLLFLFCLSLFLLLFFISLRPVLSVLKQEVTLKTHWATIFFLKAVLCCSVQKSCELPMISL